MAFSVPRIVPNWLLSLCWSAFILWAGAISIISSLTPAQLALFSAVTFWDKGEHFTVFALGGAILTIALRWSVRWPAAWIGLVALLALSAFGAVDEIHQLATPGRAGGDVWDWLADTLGAAAAVWLILVIYARYARVSYFATE